ncbi:MAG: alanine dehydrogenase [Pseudomonadota bacterium]
MRVGVPTEIKVAERRVGMTDDGVADLTRAGHAVYVQSGAGEGVSIPDAQYEAAGATIVADADAVFDSADLIIKVKEPQLVECEKLTPRHTLFTYLHLAADKPQAEALCASGCTAIAYETITAPEGGLPLLRPMSQVAGRLSVQVGAHLLESAAGGRGLLLSGVPGVGAAKVVILGGGVAGTNALQMALGARADVTLFEKSVARLEALDLDYGTQTALRYSSHNAIAAAVADADLIIGTVLIPGAAAPKLITRDMLGDMKKGTVLVDVSIDQGGCFETSRPTTHKEPTYEVDGVVHYCVANMPGGVARTSTFALTNATLPYVHRLASGGLDLLTHDAYFREGVNVHDGKVTHEAVAEALEMPFAPYAA